MKKAILFLTFLSSFLAFGSPKSSSLCRAIYCEDRTKLIIMEQDYFKNKQNKCIKKILNKYLHAETIKFCHVGYLPIQFVKSKKVLEKLLVYGAELDKEVTIYWPWSNMPNLTFEHNCPFFAIDWPVFTVLVADSTPEVIKLLLETNKVDVNVLPSKGDKITPLMVAAYLGKEEIVKLLLDYGADPNLKTKKCYLKTSKKGFTAADFAKMNQQKAQRIVDLTEQS